MTVRRAPKSPFDTAPKGHCRMCGEVIPSKTGEPHKGRSWCDAHKVEGRIRQHAVFARAAVFLRDMGICRDCGEDCTNYAGQSWDEDGTPYAYAVQINRERAAEWCERLLWKVDKEGNRKVKPQNPRNPQSTECIDLGQWEADHAYPLWLVDRDEPDAWKYWTLENLRTRCPTCHQAKTDKEAGQRAKVKRLNGTTKKRSKYKIKRRQNPWPARRKIQSRGFDSKRREP